MKQAKLIYQAQLAHASYLQNPAGFLEHYKKITIENNVAWYLKSKEKTTIIFRGTDTLWSDWKQSNLIFWPHKECKDFKAHAGFYDGALKFMQHCQKEHLLDSPLELIGHSLGGAIALMFGIIAADNGFPVESISTFGAPRGMDEAGADKHRALGLESKTWQVRNGSDPVCRIMLSFDTTKKVLDLIGLDVRVGASHPWCHEIITNHQTGKIIESPDEWQNVRAKEPDTVTRIEKFASEIKGLTAEAFIVDDHMISNYIKGLGG